MHFGEVCSVQEKIVHISYLMKQISAIITYTPHTPQDGMLCATYLKHIKYTQIHNMWPNFR